VVLGQSASIGMAAKIIHRCDALERCKPRQLIGILEVRYGGCRFLHRVIHTNVENFTEEKYLRRSSAEVMQCGPSKSNVGALKTESRKGMREFWNG